MRCFFKKESLLHIISKYDPGISLFMNKTQRVIKGCQRVDQSVTFFEICDVDVLFGFDDSNLQVEVFPETNSIKYHAPKVALRIDLGLKVRPKVGPIEGPTIYSKAVATGTLNMLSVEFTSQLVDKRIIADQSQQAKIIGAKFMNLDVDWDAKDIHLKIDAMIVSTFILKQIPGLRGMIVHAVIDVFKSKKELNNLSNGLNKELMKSYPEATPLDNRLFPGVSISLLWNENMEIVDTGILVGIEGLIIPSKYKDNMFNYPKNVACQSSKDRIKPSAIKKDLQVVLGECFISSFLDSMIEADWKVHIKLNNTLLEDIAVGPIYWDQNHLKVSENHVYGAVAVNVDTVVFSKQVNMQMKFYFKLQLTRREDPEENDNLIVSKDNDRLGDPIHIDPHIHPKGLMLIFDGRLKIWDFKDLKITSKDLKSEDITFLGHMLKNVLMARDIDMRGIRVPNYCAFDETCTKDGDIQFMDGYIKVDANVDV